jgi:subtilisin family serine protease
MATKRERNLGTTGRRWLVERLEDRVTPAYLISGTDAGGGPHVRVFDTESGAVIRDLFPYSSEFRGGVRVASGDITGDGVPDILTAAGTGGGPHVKVIDGVTFNDVQSFFAFDPALRDGVYLASGDVNGDGRDDLVTAAGAGGGPRVTVRSGIDSRVLFDFFAYSPLYTGGVQVAVGDVNGDGFGDIITGTGAGGGPNVKVFNGRDGTAFASFFAYAPEFTGGVYVAAGDTDGDGRAEVITGPGAGGGPQVNLYSGAALAANDPRPIESFFAYPEDFFGGVRVGATDVDGDYLADILTGAGVGGGPLFQALSVDAGSRFFRELFGTADALRTQFLYSPQFTGGIFIAGGGQRSFVKVDPADDLAQNVIDLGTLTDNPLTTTGTGSFENPFALYRFQILQPTTVSIRMTEQTGDVDLELYQDLTGNRRIDFDDYLGGSFAGRGQNDELFGTIAAGEYFIRAITFDPGTFRLTVSEGQQNTGIPDLGTLPGNPLSTTSTVTGSEFFERFSFNLTSDQTVTLQLDNLSADADVGLFTDEDGNGAPDTLVVSSAEFGTNNEQIVQPLRAGRYFVVVFTFADTADYTLTVSSAGTVPPPPPPPVPPPPPPVGPPPVAPPPPPTFVLPPKNPSAFDPYFGYGLIRADRAVSAALGRDLGAAPLLTQADGDNFADLNQIGVAAAWNAGITGQGVVVAVIDSGTNFGHFELEGRLWSNSKEQPNGIDDDGNGLVDDLRGADFVNRDGNPADDPITAEGGHGSHVAGTILANRNGRGITGVAYGAQLMTLEALGTNADRSGQGGSNQNIIAAIDYAILNGARVINMSLGIPVGVSFSANDVAAYRQAFRRARENNVVVVISSGNDGNNPTPGVPDRARLLAPNFPARFAQEFDNLIAVGSVNTDGRFSHFSNGMSSTPIPLNGVVAPGAGRLTGQERTTDGLDLVTGITSLQPEGDGFVNLVGTSMAAPHVAGLAALLFQANPTLTATAVADLISRSAVADGIFVG